MADLVLRWRADLTEVVSSFNTVQQSIDKFYAGIQRMGGGQISQTLTRDFAEAADQVNVLANRLAEVNRLQQQLASSKSNTVNITAASGLRNVFGRGGRVSAEQLDVGQAALKQELEGLLQNLYRISDVDIGGTTEAIGMLAEQVNALMIAAVQSGDLQRLQELLDKFGRGGDILGNFSPEQMRAFTAAVQQAAPGVQELVDSASEAGGQFGSQMRQVMESIAAQAMSFTTTAKAAADYGLALGGQKFKSEQLVASQEAVVDVLERTKSALESGGDGDGLFEWVGDQPIEEINGLLEELEEMLDHLDHLGKADIPQSLKSLFGSRRKRANREEIEAAMAEVEGRFDLGSYQPRGDLMELMGLDPVTLETVTARLDEAKEKLSSLNSEYAALGTGDQVAMNEALTSAQATMRELLGQAHALAQAWTENLGQITSVDDVLRVLSSSTQGVANEARNIMSGQAIAAAMAERRKALEAERRVGIDLEARIKAEAMQLHGRRQALQLSQQLASAKAREERATKGVEEAELKRLAALRQIERISRERDAGAFRQASQDVMAGRTPDYRSAELTPAQLQVIEDYRAALDEITRAQVELSNAKEEDALAQARLNQALQATGGAENLERVRRILAATVEELSRLDAPTMRAQLGDAVSEDFYRNFETLSLTMRELEGAELSIREDPGSVSPERLQELRNQLELLVKSMREELAEASKGNMDILAGVEADLQQGLPRLEQLIVAAFSDIGNRFRATFQFAMSGAIIYGLQQFAREAFDTALEVERAFADIDTAMRIKHPEMTDIEVGLEVEGVRRDILDIANDFNVLPTEANKAGYQMVARFGEVSNAMKALRAQLLATKVSTIEQGEVLRALTATAETFADSIITANSNLTIQERLLRRESIAAENYGKALDMATRIQQRFGIEAEDALEGAARASEVFVQSGFNMEQTMAIVSAASLRLGQTGTQVAERFGRAFGGVTPEIIEELVTFAARTDGLSLSYTDFAENIANGLMKLQAQFDQLDPSRAQQLINILGQRRETDVVAAFFGTGDLQQSIISDLGNSAGAAESRFRVLERTTVEMFESIKVQANELAQNFERLGALNPLQVALDSFDKFLGLINSVTKAFRDLYDLMNRFQPGGHGLGELVVQLGTLALSAGALMRLFQAMLAVGPSLSAFVRPGAGGGVAAAAGAVDMAGGAAATAATLRATRTAAAFGTVLGTITSGMLRFGTAIATPIQTLKSLSERALTAGGGFLGLKAMTDSLVASKAREVLVTRLAASERLRDRFLTRTWTGTPGSVATPQGSFVLQKGAVAMSLGVTAIVAGVVSVASAFQGGARVAREYRDAMKSAEQAARDRISAEDLTGTEAEVVLLENQLAEMDGQIAGAMGGFRGGILNTFVQIRRLFDRELNQAMGDTDRTALARQLADRNWSGNISPVSLDRYRDTQTEQGMRLRQEDIERDLYELQREMFQQMVESMTPEGRAGTADLMEQARRDIQAIDFLMGQEHLGEKELAELQRRRNEAVARFEQIGVRAANIAASALEGFNTSLTLLKEKLEEIQFRRQVGGLAAGGDPMRSSISAGAEEDLLRGVIHHYDRLLEAATDPDQIERIVSERRSAIQQLASQLQGQLSSAQAEAGLIQNTEQRILKEVENIDQFMADMDDDERELTEEYIDLRNERVKKMQELFSFRWDREVARSQHQVSMAFNADQELGAIQNLIATLIRRRAAELNKGMSEAAEETARAIELEELAATNIRLDQARISKVARVRLAGPVLSEMTRINAEIAGLRLDMQSGRLSFAEFEAAQQQLRELLVQRAQEQARAVAAFIRLQAGTRNELSNLQAELTILAEELKNTASWHGKTSAAYLEVELRYKQAQDAIIDATLRLNDLNRRLAANVDITNPFTEAQLDLIRIMEAMSQEGLGELERAELTLERRRAEANALRQFYSDRLFDLQFDFERGTIGEDVYVSALRRLQATVDVTTRQGKEIWLEIERLINGMVEDVTDMSFNIPGAIRLPTIYEVRRALAADQLGVNYMDNRQQDITLEISNEVDLEAVLRAIDNAMGDGVGIQARRSGVGASPLTAGLL